MWRKVLFFSAFLSVILILPGLVNASVFEADQETASRTAMDFEGGYVEELAVDGSGTVWAGLMYPNGIYYYSEATGQWIAPPEGSDFGNIVDVKASDSHVFAIGGIDLLRTADGSSWETLSPTNVNQEMYYDQIDDKLYVVMRGTSADGDALIQVSDDEGDTFTEVEVDGVESISSIAAAGNNIYVLTDTGSEVYSLFMSADAGSTWNDTGNTFAGTSQVQVSASTTEQDLVVVRYGDASEYSLDAGVSFTDINTNVGGKILIIGTKIYLGMNYTTDYGANWSSLEADGFASPGRNALAIDPNDPDAIYTDLESGVLGTTDGGASWTEMYSGLYGITIYDIAQATDRDVVLLAAYGGIAKTTNFTDASPTWSYPLGSSTATAIYIDDDIALAGMNSDIYYSVNEGTSWTSAEASLAGSSISDIIKNDGRYYVSHDAGLSSSIDGINWTADTSLAGLPVASLASDSDGNLYAGMGSENDDTATNRGIYKFNGSSWAQLTGDIEGHMINDLMVVGDAVFAASGNTGAGGVFRSEDSGTTWTALDVSDMGWYHAMTYNPSDTDTLYVSTARPAGTGEIYKSDDNGDSWDLFYTGLKDEAFTALHYSGVDTIASGLDRYTASSKGYTGLLAGSNTTLFKMYSNTSWKVKKSKKKVIKNKKLRLTYTLKDATSKTKLKQKKVRLFKKTANKKWKKIKTAKTNKKGKVTFKGLKISKKTYFKAKWTPKKTALKKEYGLGAKVSSRSVVKLKK